MRADRHWTWAVYSAALITRLKGCPVNRALPVVRLRVPTDEDAVAWHRVFDDPDVMEFHGGRSAELSAYEELTARQRRHDAELGFCLWTMTDESGCSAERLAADEEMLSALGAVTGIALDGDVVTLTGPKTLRFRAATN